MALRGFRPQVEDMWIGFNMTAFVKYDDVIIYCKLKLGHEVVYCMQVKHRMGMLMQQQLVGSSGDFSLCANQSSVSEIRKILAVLMGREVPFICGFITSMTANTEKSDIFIPVDDCFFHSSQESKTYTLFANRVVGSCKNYLDPAYVSNVLVCTGQVHAPLMEGTIQKEICDVLESYGIKSFDLEQIARNYLSFIDKWVEGDLCGWNTLTKTILLYKIIELVSDQYKTVFVNSQCNKFAPFFTWNYLTENKEIVVVSSNDVSLKFVSNVILNKISRIYNKTTSWQSKIDKSEFYQSCTEDLKFEMLSTVGKYGDIFMEDLYTILWKLGRIPAVFKACSIDDYVEILNILKMTNFAVSAVIMSEVDLGDLPDVYENFPRPVKSMSDLDEPAQKMLLKHNVLLQGKGPMKLQDIIGDDDVSIYQKISTNDVINLIQGEMDIGNNLDALPDIHLCRTVPRIGLPPQVLSNYRESFVINSEEARYMKYVEDNQFQIQNFFIEDKPKLEDYIYRTDHDNFENYSANCTKKGIHYLLLHDSGELEWIKTRGEVKNIGSYRQNMKLEPIEVENVATHFSNSINIISADPGAGKSILMRYLSLTYQKFDWILPIDLNKYMSYYDTPDFCNKQSAAEHLRYFNGEILAKKHARSALNLAVFEYLLKRKRILVLLDAFDEIAPLYTKEVTFLALSIRREDYPMWLTTRPVMRNHVESIFETFSLTLTLFNDVEQSILLGGYYKVRVKPETYRQLKMIEQFVWELLGKCKQYLNDFDNRFMGIPLQIFLLGQVFADNCYEYVTTGCMDVMRFDLLYLYDRFTKLKINIVVEKFGHNIKFTHKNLHENHCLYALKVLFAKEDLSHMSDYLEVKIASFMDDIKDASDKTGIVVADINVNFIHRSVSEYYAAYWLSENLHTETGRQLMEKIFDPNYSVIRNVFDRLLARNSALLTAVINQQYILVKDLLNESNKSGLDKAERNILCIAASWGDPHVLPNMGNLPESGGNTIRHTTNATKIMDLLLEHDIAYIMDPLLKMTPIDYAIKTRSLAAANSLIKKYASEELIIEGYNQNDYLYVCARYNYPHLAKKILVHWNIGFLLQIDSFCEGLTPLHVACTYGHTEMVELLLEYKASPNLPCKNGITPIQYAQRNANIRIINILSKLLGGPRNLAARRRPHRRFATRRDLFQYEPRMSALDERFNKRISDRQERFIQLRKKREEENENNHPSPSNGDINNLPE